MKIGGGGGGFLPANLASRHTPLSSFLADIAGCSLTKNKESVHEYMWYSGLTI